MLKNNNPAHKLTVEEARKGGRNSGKVRGEKKLIRQIVSDYLNGSIGSCPPLNELAQAIGLETSDSIKRLAVVKLLINSLKDGDIKDIKTLMELVGEGPTEVDGGGGVIIIPEVGADE